MTRFSWLVASSMVLFVAAGCAATNAGNDSSAASSESQLRTIGADEIVGTISYGQTVGPIQYTENPRYRALRFEGRSGDIARISVKSTGVAALWLLSSDFGAVASAKATGLGRDLLGEWTLPSTGSFYITLREADQESAEFTVTLERRDSVPPPPPIDADFQNDCTGESGPLSAYFVPGTTTAADVGSFRVAGRHRTCTTATGCGAYVRDDGILYRMYFDYDHAGPQGYSVRSGVVDLTIDTSTTTNPFLFSLRPLHSDGEPTPTNHAWTCNAATGKCDDTFLQIEAANEVFSVGGETWLDEYSQSPAGHRCFYARLEGTHYVSAQQWMEAEVAIRGTLRGSVMSATSRSRPEQRGQQRTSNANVRIISSAHGR